MSQPKPCNSIGIQYGFWLWNNADYEWKGGAGQEPPPPATEDFTTYTEVDPNSHITFTALHIDWIARMDETAYLRYDKGVNHFGDFIHKFDVKLITSNNAKNYPCYALTNDLGDICALNTASKPFIDVRIGRHTDGWIFFILNEGYAGVQHSSQSVQGDNFALDTMYYCTVIKASNALTLNVYTDTQRTVLKKTLVLQLQIDHKFRYIMPCVTYNDAESGSGDIDIENLILS
jgi:hypothetical protein